MLGAISAKVDFGEAWNVFTSSNRDRVKLSTEQEGKYVVLHREQDSEHIHLEVSAGRQLPKGAAWSPLEAQYLYDLGLRQSRASRNFSAKLAAEDIDSHAMEKLVGIAEKLFESGQPGEGWSVFEGTRLRIETKGLEDAMNHLARQRDWQARTGLYSVLLASRLLVPVEDEGTGSKTTFKAVDKVGSRPVAAAFSSYENLDRFAPMGLKAVALPGDVLFPELLSAGVGILKLDPNSSPSGELYANEFQILVDGLKRMRGMH